MAARTRQPCTVCGAGARWVHAAAHVPICSGACLQAFDRLAPKRTGGREEDELTRAHLGTIQGFLPGVTGPIADAMAAGRFHVYDEYTEAMTVSAAPPAGSPDAFLIAVCAPSVGSDGVFYTMWASWADPSPDAEPDVRNQAQTTRLDMVRHTTGDIYESRLSGEGFLDRRIVVHTNELQHGKYYLTAFHTIENGSVCYVWRSETLPSVRTGSETLSPVRTGVGFVVDGAPSFSHEPEAGFEVRSACFTSNGRRVVALAVNPATKVHRIYEMSAINGDVLRLRDYAEGKHRFVHLTTVPDSARMEASRVGALGVAEPRAHAYIPRVMTILAPSNPDGGSFGTEDYVLFEKVGERSYGNPASPVVVSIGRRDEVFVCTDVGPVRVGRTIVARGTTSYAKDVFVGSWPAADGKQFPFMVQAQLAVAGGKHGTNRHVIAVASSGFIGGIPITRQLLVWEGIPAKPT